MTGVLKIYLRCGWCAGIVACSQQIDRYKTAEIGNGVDTPRARRRLEDQIDRCKTAEIGNGVDTPRARRRLEDQIDRCKTAEIDNGVDMPRPSKGGRSNRPLQDCRDRQWCRHATPVEGWTLWEITGISWE